MEYAFHRKELGNLDPKLVEIFDEVARQTMPAFSINTELRPMLAFTVKKTAYHDDKARGYGFFDEVYGDSIFYSTDRAIIPSKPINYLDQNLKGTVLNIVIARAPAFDSKTTTFKGEFYHLFIECVETTGLKKLKGGKYGYKMKRAKESERYEALFLDRVKDALKAKILQSSDYVIAEAGLRKFESMRFTELIKSFFGFRKAMNTLCKNVSENVSKELEPVIAETE